MLELNNENFEKELENNSLILVDFYATWCGPCKMMHPVISQIAAENNNLKIIKVDVDKHQDLVREYSVMSIPTLIMFKNKEIVKKNIGFTSKDVLTEWIKEYEN